MLLVSYLFFYHKIAEIFACSVLTGLNSTGLHLSIAIEEF